LKPETFSSDEPVPTAPPTWVRIGLVAAATVVLGGMAAAWWYRKTLIRLRQAEETAGDPQFGISPEDASEEL